MTPMRLNVLCALFAYGGNGGVATLLPEIAMWWANLCHEMTKDDRIDRIEAKKFGDCPLTMERNRAVRVAKDIGADVLMMIDSDNVPDLYLNVLADAKPFWKTSFDFLYERRLRGLPTVIAAPYCGPPPHPTKGGMENVYVFHGEVMEGDLPNTPIKLTGYSREQASQMRGIQPMAAGPTGCIIYSMDAFDLMPVHSLTQEEILLQHKTGALSLERAKTLLNMQSWFCYEYTNGEQTEKATTDDVFSTREIQLAGLVKHREPVVFCNWDAWAGHYKPKCVGKPFPVPVEQINELYREAVANNMSGLETMRDMDFTAGLDMSHVIPADDEENQPVAEIATVDPVSPLIDPATDPLQQPPNIPGLNPKPEVQWSRRMIAGRSVMSVGGFGGGQTPESDLQALAEVVHLVATSRPKQPLRIVEVGSWVGETAIAMHQGFGPFGGTVFCVDTWEGSASDMSGVMAREIGFDKLFSVFRDNVGDLLDKSIKVIRGESTQVAAEMDPQGLDMVFIDADHSYDCAIADIRAWMKHLAPTGVMAGHDWTVGFPGVAQAVKEVCDEAGIMPRVVQGATVWFFPMSEYLEGMQKKNQVAVAKPHRNSKPKKGKKRGRRTVATT